MNRAYTRVDFHTSVDGMSTGGQGNYLSVEFLRPTGQLARVTAISDCQYAPVKVVLTPDQAQACAAQLVKTHAPTKVSEFIDIRKQFIIAMPGFGCTVYESDRAAKRFRYAYFVTFKKLTILIDPTDGKSLGGFESHHHE